MNIYLLKARFTSNTADNSTISRLSSLMYFLLFINSHLFSIYLSNFALTYFQHGIAKGKK